MQDTQLGHPKRGANRFDAAAARERCKTFRGRILDMSQNVPALHIGGAFSCTELVDNVYYELMRYDADGRSPDTFLMSKGHGCMILYVILQALGILTEKDLADYCTPEGRLGVHPDYGVPGIEASTGSLGHGLSMAVGMALAERGAGRDGRVYTVVSDGELQEGSTWEAAMMATTLDVRNLILLVDNNDFQSLGRTSETHPSFYPLDAKLEAFGWEVATCDGHDPQAIFEAVTGRSGARPFCLIGQTVKGKGVSYMESVTIWHFRSPNAEEYELAKRELGLI